MTSHRTLNLLDRRICSNAGDWEMWLSWKCERIEALGLRCTYLTCNCFPIVANYILIQSWYRVSANWNIHKQIAFAWRWSYLYHPFMNMHLHERKNYEHELFSTMISIIFQFFYLLWLFLQLLPFKTFLLLCCYLLSWFEL